MSGLKFDKTYCSQCGGEFGPGDSGYSSCLQHPSRLAREERRAMRFGDVVMVTRGSERIPFGKPGCLRKVPAILIGAKGADRTVRLLRDDLMATVSMRKAGDVGHYDADCVRPALWMQAEIDAASEAALAWAWMLEGGDDVDL